MIDPIYDLLDFDHEMPAGSKFDYDTLSVDARQAWQRGFDLAHPGTGRPSPLLEWLEGVAKEHGGRFAAMDRVSVLAIDAEVEKQQTEECKTAMAHGFLHGMIAKAEAARSDDDD